MRDEVIRLVTELLENKDLPEQTIAERARIEDIMHLIGNKLLPLLPSKDKPVKGLKINTWYSNETEDLGFVNVPVEYEIDVVPGLATLRVTVGTEPTRSIDIVPVGRVSKLRSLEAIALAVVKLETAPNKWDNRVFRYIGDTSSIINKVNRTI